VNRLYPAKHRFNSHARGESLRDATRDTRFLRLELAAADGRQWQAVLE